MAVDTPDRGQQEWDIPLNEALEYLEAHAAAVAEQARQAAQTWVGAQVEAVKDRASHTGTQHASTVTGLFTPAGTSGRIGEAQLDPAVRSQLATTAYQSAWNLQPHLAIGPYEFWFDTQGGLRMGLGAPSSDTAGSVLGYTTAPDATVDPGTLYPSVYGYGSTAAPTLQPMRNVTAVALDATRIQQSDQLPLDTNGITGVRRSISGPGITPTTLDYSLTSRSATWINLTSGATYTLTSAALYGTTVGPVTTVTASPSAAPPPPPPPTLTATTTSSTTVRLSWTA